MRTTVGSTEAVELHLVAHLLVERLERAGAHHDLVVGLDRPSGQDRWDDARARLDAEQGHVEPVDVVGAEVDGGPVVDPGVVVEELDGGLGVDAAVAGGVEQRGVPVPAVQARGADQRIEAGGEAQRRDQRGDGEDRSGQHGAHRHGGGARARLERQPGADHRGGPEPGGGRRLHRARRSRSRAAGPEPGWRWRTTATTSSATTTSEDAEAQHRPVGGHAAIDLDPADRTDRGRRATAPTARRTASADPASTGMPASSRAMVQIVRRGAPRARRTSSLPASLRTCRTSPWPISAMVAAAAARAEDAQGERDGPHGSLGAGHVGGGDPEDRPGALRQQIDEAAPGRPGCRRRRRGAPRGSTRSCRPRSPWP